MYSYIKNKLRLPSGTNSFPELFSVLRRLFSTIGIGASIKYIIFHKLKLGFLKKGVIRPRGLGHPLEIRWQTSDPDVFNLIFFRQEYACLQELTEVNLIIDCGANVGYSSAYLLSQFPRSRVVAVEPDPDNFAVLSRNMAPYGERVKLCLAGIWSHDVALVLAPEIKAKGSEWARQVRLSRPGEPGSFRGVGIGSMLADSGYERISLLKMDIEGSECVVFSEHFSGWLDKVDAIAIELHDNTGFGNATEIFFAAIAGRGFEISRSEELVICVRPQPQPALNPPKP